MEYIAHSENSFQEAHSLSKHLYETAKLSSSFAWKEDYKPIFYLAGLLHDLGKYQTAFQEYIRNGGKRGSVPHASWGAGLTRIKNMLEISFVIDGHHKGIPDKSTWKFDTEPFKRNEKEEYEAVVSWFLEDNQIEESELCEKLPEEISKMSSHREIFIRYLFSALTDSDWLSTEKHFDKSISEIRSDISLPIEEMINKLEVEFLKKSKEGKINELRNAARYEALEKANQPCGFYSLSLPTGMGKTLTSMAWALRHAKTNTLKRIIIVLPFVNIIDQTAQVLKNIFDDELVLEHHSNFNEDDTANNHNEANYSLIEQRKKLACENWNYPVIVTTTVQFFESLFSNRPSKCRKIHNISESVVIFDEVQTLPKEVILPTLQILKDVQTIMKTSFLFCTATQPAFEKRKGFDGIENIQPLITDPAEMYQETKRVEYKLLNDLKPIDLPDLLKTTADESISELVIFNTKKPTLEFFNLVKSNTRWENKYHLSTGMCPDHRKRVIRNIRDDLTAKRKILVSSTQLIEAGVDFDFPLVFRALAPLESIIQAAGRCNRENNLGPSGGKVFLFKMNDSAMPDKTYSACANHAEEFIKPDIEQLHDPETFNRYYAQVVNLYVNPDQYNINQARKDFNFQTVNDSYRIIRDSTEGLYMYNYSDESRQLFHSIEHKEFLSKDDYRKMQMFTVSVYRNFIIKNSANCKTMPQGFMVWYGNYDQQTGISIEPLEADKLIV
ncbi:MAG TPA: CRISPR-associated helicase Cas3' [Smithellaceae bacterium]|nr:CRISPR-associated helicase Cas3' [Smithellaceae bacterium]HRY37813.1 CRISPR-associated helicase Cas3' [Smithellaceae bacterium]